MADEIRIGGELRLNLPSANENLTRSYRNIDIDQAGTNWIESTMDVSSAGTGTSVPLGDVATLGWAYFRNTDASIVIEVGTVVAAAFEAVISLAGTQRCGPFPLSDNITVLTAKAASGTPTLEYFIIEA